MNSQNINSLIFVSIKLYHAQQTLQSIFHTEAEEGKLLVPYLYNDFAFLFHQFGEKELSKQVISKINGRMTIYPWAYLGIENNKELQAL